ncbi:hypothetical protein PG994_006230 [Apiospora phragmitis]|uniref:GPI anchored protein n=1 Tax=Apiospora phragmitis TaxID=2905665 RepID=A0ABR1VEG6_9PEZI
MRVVLSLLVMGSASIVVAQQPRQRVEHSAGLFPGGGDGVVLAAASSSCVLAETTCESGCIPIGSVVSILDLVMLSQQNESDPLPTHNITSPLHSKVRRQLTNDASSQCCKDGTNTYCPINSVCNPGGCCPIGKTCKDGSGASSCAAGKTMCGIGCMPTTADCCSDGAYCPSGSKCSSGGYCCRIGQTCSGSSGGSSAGSAGHSTTLIGGGSGSGAVTTSSRRATSTPTSDDLESATSKLSFPAAQTADDTTKATTAPTKNSTNPGTVTVTPTATGLPGGSSASGAGALDRADGKLAVGLAVAAALLI